MARRPPPPWVRWIGQDTIASCRQLTRAMDSLELAVIAETPKTAIECIISFRQELTQIEQDMHKLQKAAGFDDLAQWVRQDRELRLYLRTLEGEN